MPHWAEHVVWWQVYPLGAVGADPTGAAGTGDGAPAHRLGQLESWLDYAVELGASGLALGPVFAAETHGYDTIDHFQVDPRLGDGSDLARLFDAAHRRGLRVLLDGVFNHVGRGFPAFRRALAGGPSAPEAGWFRLTWPDRPDGPAAEPSYERFEGHPGLVALNHAEPAVQEYVAGVMCHWLERGADGWRLDAAYAVPVEFWAAVLPRVRRAHPDAWFVGEVIHGDYAGVVASSGLDSVTQYELWKAVWSALNDGNFFELAWALGRHNGYLDSFAPLTFVGNHDVTRLASRLRTERHLPHALVVLLTVGGVPSIYYGDEQAFRGVKEDRAGGDDAVRPALPTAPAALAPYGWPTYRLHQLLIGLRRRHPWLHRARVTPIRLTNTQLSYQAAAGDQRLFVALNLDDTPAEFELPATGVLAGTATGAGAGAVTVPAHGWAILG